jgi:hypothetical protein
MEGYEVVTLDGKRAGRIVDMEGYFYVVERGWPWRSRRPVPKRFVKPDPGARSVYVGISRSTLSAAPRVTRRGTFDEEAARSFYDLD